MKVVYYEGINLLKPKWERSKIGKFIFTFCKKNCAIVLFQVFVPDEKKNKCQNARAALAEFSSFSVARAGLCTCCDLHVRGVRSISTCKNFRFTFVVALAASWFQKYGLVVLNCSAKTLQSNGNRGTK